MVDGDDLSKSNVRAKWSTPCEKSQAVYFSPHNSGNIIESEKLQLMRMESQPQSFQPTINQGHALPKSSAKWGSDTQIQYFLKKFPQESVKSLLQCFTV